MAFASLLFFCYIVIILQPCVQQKTDFILELDVVRCFIALIHRRVQSPLPSLLCLIDSRAEMPRLCSPDSLIRRALFIVLPPNIIRFVLRKFRQSVHF